MPRFCILSPPLLSAVFLFVCLHHLPAQAECSLSFLPIEESKYLLKANGCQDASLISFAVDYDTAYLFGPELTIMGGELDDAPAPSARPGLLRVGIRNPDRNKMIEGTLFFQKRGEFPAVINFVTAEVSDKTGAASPLPVELAAPVNLPEEPAEVGAQEHSGADEALLENLVDLGDQAETEKSAAAQRTRGVLDRFREFRGPKTLAGFRSLFEDVDPCCRQLPPILVADGKKTVRLLLNGMEAAATPPRLSATGGKVLSVERGGDGEQWTVVVQPDPSAWEVRIGGSFANAVVDFPVTVVPPIDVSPATLARITDGSFAASLKAFVDRSQEGEDYPLWVKEYLFTANLLAARAAR